MKLVHVSFSVFVLGLVFVSPACGAGGESLGGVYVNASGPGVSIHASPSVVHSFRGGLRSLMVTVKNSGGLVLEDAGVFLSGPVVLNKVVPAGPGVLEPGSGMVFVLEITVPSSLSVGEYTLVLRAVAGGVSDERYIPLVVSDEPDRVDAVRAEIGDLGDLINGVWFEAVHASAGGRNVSEVFVSLNEAGDCLDGAEVFLGEGRYGRAGKLLGEARECIGEAVVGLSVPVVGGVDVRRVVLRRTVIPSGCWLFAGAAFAAMVLLAYSLHRKKVAVWILRQRLEGFSLRERIFGHKH